MTPIGQAARATVDVAAKRATAEMIDLNMI
jgi:hypothetical protein